MPIYESLMTAFVELPVKNRFGPSSARDNFHSSSYFDKFEPLAAAAFQTFVFSFTPETPLMSTASQVHHSTYSAVPPLKSAESVTSAMFMPAA